MRPGLCRRTALAGVVAAIGSALCVAAAPPAAALTVSESYTRPANGVFTVSGHGWGHGRGMSQYGAQGAATQGKTADAITAFYYPGTTKQVIAKAPIRIELLSDDHVDTRVFAKTGLYALNMATSPATKITLPSGPAQWKASLDSTGYLRLSSLTGSTWTMLAGKYAGPLRFTTGVSTDVVRLILPDGTSRDYREAVQAVKLTSTTLQSVAVMSMEHYLLGVVPRESLSSWKPAALQAQAIAARSYSAYKRAHASTSQIYDICDTTQCQVFMGTASYTSSGTRTALEPTSTTDAVNATAGVVRAYNGSPVFAEFSSSNGGWSVDGGLPYLIAQRDDWDGVTGSSVHSWTASLPVSAIEAHFPSLGSFRKLTVTQRDGNGEWGGRVLSVTLNGVDSSGATTTVTTTGAGIYHARVWPAYSDGLRSSWWHIIPAYAASLVSRSKAPTLVLAPGNPKGTLTAVVQNGGTVAWPTSGLHLAVASPAGSPDPMAGNSTRPGVYVGDLTNPGATSVAPGDRASFRISLDATGQEPGLVSVGYRLRIGTAALFGPVISWSVPIVNPVLTAAVGAAPTLVSTTLTSTSGAPPALFADGRTVVVPRAGSTTVRLSSKNTGNVTWPAGSTTPVELGTSGPRDRVSSSAGSGWVTTSRPARLGSSAAVAPGSVGTFDLKLYGNSKAAGVTTEAFEPVWQGQSWLTGDSTSLRVVRVDTAVSRAAVTDLAPATGFSMVNAPNGSRLVTVRLRNVGGQPWTVGTEKLGTSTPAALANGWPSTTRTPPLSRNVTRPGQSAVYPGEVGEWRVPVTAYKHAAGTYTMSLRAVGPSGFYGPSLPVTVKVVQASFTYSIFSVHGSVDVPSNGTAVTYFYVKNTGNVAWPVGGSLRSTVIAGSSPSHASTWYSASRPGSLSSNASAAGATLVAPGQVAKFLVVLAGNGRARQTTSELFGMAWDGWRGTTLKATLAYRVV